MASSAMISRIKEMSAGEAKEALVRAREAAARLRSESKQLTERGMVAFAGNGGAVACGLLKAFELEEIADVPVAPAVGFAMQAAGFVGAGGSETGNYALIAFGSAMSAPYLSDTVADMFK